MTNRAGWWITPAPPMFYNYAIVDPYVYYLAQETRAALDGARLAEAGGPRDLSTLRVYPWP